MSSLRACFTSRCTPDILNPRLGKWDSSCGLVFFPFPYFPLSFMILWSVRTEEDKHNGNTRFMVGERRTMRCGWLNWIFFCLFIYILYWSVIDLQCIGFRCTTKWICDTHTYTHTHTHIYIYTNIHSYFRFFSQTGYYRALRRVSCAIHYALVGYLFYT